ncbi:hypothetical protein L9G16_01965 [Shewanella sp. A25]|nr:hypothetical protein [Shewanella shenzhenensis]
MKAHILFAGLLFMGHGQCASVPIEKLIGTWGSSDDGGKTFWGFDQYFANGTIKSWGTLPESDESFRVEAQYRIKVKFGTFACLTVTQSQPYMEFVGESWCDEIIEVNDAIFKYRTDDGVITTLYRQVQ